jgi:hypothetical protein
MNPRKQSEGGCEGRLPEETRAHLRTARDEFRRSVEVFLPPEFLEHRRRARKEMLLAARSLIDHVLSRMEEGGKA